MRNTGPGGFARRYHFVPISLIVLFSLLAAIPVFRFGIPFGMDSAEHLSWYRCFVAQLGAGELYPRWLLAMNGGLGSPDLFVYGPLPYYAAAAFHVFTGPGREVYDLGFSIVGALILAGCAAYFWLRQLAGGTLVPTLGALIYIGVPYVLKTDLYTRAALAEFWAFAWMPLILYFTCVLIDRRTPAGLAGLAVGWGLLLVTHLFTALLFAPLPLLYTAWLARPSDRVRSVVAALFGMLGGAALAGFYLAPAFYYEKYISAYKLIETRPDYRFERNFLFSHVAPTPYLNSLSRFTAWTVVVAGLFGAAALMAKPIRLRRETSWWTAVAAVSLLFMLPVSTWFWTHLPVLGAIQFPSRLNTLVTISTAALAVTGMESLRQDWRWQKAALVGLGLLLAAAWIPPLIVTLRYQHKTVQQIAPMNVDYLITAWAQWTDPKLVSVRGIPIDASDPKVIAQSGTAIAETWQPRFITFHSDSPSETWVTVKQFYFPGWTASLADGRSIALRPSSPEGLITVQVPAGAADVRVRFASGVPEIAGAILSGLALIGLILGFWYGRSGERKAEPA